MGATQSISTKIDTYIAAIAEGYITPVKLNELLHDINNNAVYSDAANFNYAPVNHNHDTAYAAIVHTHVLTEVTGLQTALDAKSDNHTHPYSLDSHNHNSLYAEIVHNHNSLYAEIVHTHNYAATNHNHSGVYANASHTHSIAQVTGLQTALDNKSDVHTHPYLNLAGGTVTGPTTFEQTVTFGADVVQAVPGTIQYNNEIYSQNDFITLRNGAVGAVTGLSGFRLLKYNAVDNMLFGVDSDGWARIGDEGGVQQKIATLEETPLAKFMKYNTTSLQLESTDIAIADVISLQTSLDGKASSSHNHTGVYLPLLEDAFAIQVHDDRSNDLAPAGLDKAFRADFKFRSYIGSPGTSGAYAGLLSFAPWNDSSGGHMHQLAFTEDGNIAYRHQGLSDTEWTVPWKNIWHDGNFDPTTKSDIHPHPYASDTHNHSEIYLNVNAQAVDSARLDGEDASYYDHRQYSDATNFLGGHYSDNGVQKPDNAIFGKGKMKIAMLSGANLGMSALWYDALWISTYSGYDVKKSSALVFSKYDATSVYIVKQDYDASNWGTGYLFWNSGNFDPNTKSDVHSHPYASDSHNHSGIYANASHTHSIANVTGLQTAIDAKSDIHSHPYASDTHNHSGVYANASHTHSITNITGLQTAIDTKSDIHSHPYASDSHNHSGVYANASHTHSIANVTGLQTAIDAKQNKEVTFFGSHSSYVAVRTAGRTAGQYYEFWDSGVGWADISAGNIRESGVLLSTKYAPAHSHPYSLDSHNHSGVYANATHTHSIANVTGLQTAIDAKSDIHSHPYASSGHYHDIYAHQAYNVVGNYFGGYYVGDGTEKPNNSLFGKGKMKLAMLKSANLGFSGSWNDVLWLSSYEGGDVKRSSALVFNKYDETSVYIVKQDYDAAAWGTGYLFWNSGNFNPASKADAHSHPYASDTHNHDTAYAALAHTHADKSVAKYGGGRVDDNTKATTLTSKYSSYPVLVDTDSLTSYVTGKGIEIGYGVVSSPDYTVVPFVTATGSWKVLVHYSFSFQGASGDRYRFYLQPGDAEALDVANVTLSEVGNGLGYGTVSGSIILDSNDFDSTTNKNIKLLAKNYTSSSDSITVYNISFTLLLLEA